MPSSAEISTGVRGRVVGNRRGVLQSTEQRPEEAAPVGFLIDFVRALIRLNPSRDCMYLALASAKAKHPLTEKQTKAFVAAICGEMDQSAWPKGFF